MKVEPVESPNARFPTPARSESADHTSAVANGSTASALDASRISVVGRLIETLTGREVKLVPPTVYLVSSPPAPVKKPPAVDLIVATDFSAEQVSEQEPSTNGSSRREPLVVDVTPVLRDGTSQRMILGRTRAGAFALYSDVNLEL